MDIMLNSPHQKLEEYFAKKYTDKYVEFGGYFHIKPYNTFSNSPMREYFASGEYKELNDPLLEKYWSNAQRMNLYITIVVFLIIIAAMFF